ncbi:hypothetical protein NP511_22305 (plasmid) [Natrinema thermotolerans]|uniref:Uncharacterized protein n=1 Tax=Natrinema thermotolerans TaxID=121872 RepID=A0AAF0PFK9_9EURY|nr:hypothetical protein [Natrinema thermotolerans]WMT10240.1 hypothetical protein NP511_22305 [Natrinema thermotolerans]
MDSTSRSGDNADVQHITAGTHRGNVALVLSTNAWMSKDDVHRAITEDDSIPKPNSASGASSVLADMWRHDNVHRLEVVDQPFQYVYKLKENVVVK